MATVNDTTILIFGASGDLTSRIVSPFTAAVLVPEMSDHRSRSSTEKPR